MAFDLSFTFHPFIHKRLNRPPDSEAIKLQCPRQKLRKPVTWTFPHFKLSEVSLVADELPGTLLTQEFTYPEM